MTLDLSDEESAALLGELNRIIDGDRYPFSPRIAIDSRRMVIRVEAGKGRKDRYVMLLSLSWLAQREQTSSLHDRERRSQGRTGSPFSAGSGSTNRATTKILTIRTLEPGSPLRYNPMAAHFHPLHQRLGPRAAQR
jgi:hypothetical protein